MIYATIRAVRRAARNPYIHALLSLTAVVVVVFIVSSCDDCDSSKQATETEIGDPEVEAHAVTEDGRVFPGETVKQNLTVDSAPPGGATVTFKPPDGIDPEDVSFEGNQPSYQQDGVFVFEEMGEGEDVNARFTAPDTDLPTEDLSSQFTTSSGGFDSTVYDCSCTVSVFKEASSKRALDTLQPPPASAPLHDASENAGYSAWLSELWFYNWDESIDTAGCQDRFDLIQSPDAFVAVRFPMIAELGDQNAWRMPVAFREEHRPQISLIDYTAKGKMEKIVTVPLEPRFDRMHFASNYLPQEDGTQWFVLGGDTDEPVTCPDGLQLAGGDWEFYSEVYLDLGGVASTCSGCVYEGFACYEGDEAPAKAAAAMSEKVIREQGITCVGPLPVRLSSWNNPADPPISVSGPGYRHADPPQEIWFHHTVSSNTAVSLTVSLAVTSDRGLTWEMFGGTYETPNPGLPLSDTTTVGGYDTVNVWLRCNVPGDLNGIETVRFEVTASSAPQTPVWNTDILTIGDVTAGGSLEVELTPIEEIDSSCP